jgi:glycerol-3-phosphate O-acyltransferase/dihydroxyacetone phosphate acyltransferase
LKLAGVVPVYRAKDGGSTSRNAEAFRTCQALLARGGLVALFPEGISHDEPDLQELKTGAARIALAAAIDDGTEHVTVVPVGLSYDAKARFRSRALVRVGEPFSVMDWANQYGTDDHAAVLGLTDEMADRLRAVSPSYASWMEARTLGDIAEVMARPYDSPTPREVALGEREHLARELGAAEAVASAPADELRRAFAQYSRDLAVVGLSDSQVAANYRGGRLRLLLVWSFAKVVVGAPLALAGALAHAVPYQVIKQVAKKPANEGMKATVKLLSCFTAFSLLYAGLGVAAGISFGPLAGLAVGLGVPLCGYIAVRFSERVKLLGGALAGYRIARRTSLSMVREHRREVVTRGDVLLGRSLSPGRHAGGLRA